MTQQKMREQCIDVLSEILHKLTLGELHRTASFISKMMAEPKSVKKVRKAS